MPVVCNASPIIYLAKIGKLGLLRKLFGEVVITEPVFREVVTVGKSLGRDDAYVIERAVGEWITVRGSMRRREGRTLSWMKTQNWTSARRSP